jgi:tRNA A37 threonylcarbamoyladenosine dehydratase
LARTIKRRLKEVKIDKGVKVVFSSEIQDESSLKTTDGKNYKKSFYGTNSYMPGLFGLYAAETVIRYLLDRVINEL